MKDKRGFTLIEVLVASVLLFMAIVTASIAFKQYKTYRLKQEKYEMIYISALSLMNKLEAENLYGKKLETGTINGLAYSVNVKAVSSRRNYIYGAEFRKSGNLGRFLITLFRVTIDISGRTFTFYKTEYKVA